MDTKKIIIIVTVVIALGVGGYFYWKSTQEGKKKTDETAPDAGNTGIGGKLKSILNPTPKDVVAVPIQGRADADARVKYNSIIVPYLKAKNPGKEYTGESTRWATTQFLKDWAAGIQGPNQTFISNGIKYYNQNASRV